MAKQTVLSGGGGILYLVTADGDLRWFKDDHRNGTQGWHSNTGNAIGNGWQLTPDATGVDGMIYATDEVGQLHWYLDHHRDGTQGWAPGTGNVIGPDPAVLHAAQPGRPERLSGTVLGRPVHDRDDPRVIGPLGMGPMLKPGDPEGRGHDVLRSAAAVAPDIFRAADVDHNEVVAKDEMLVLVIENVPAEQPANRDNVPVTFKWGPFGISHETIAVHIAFDGPVTPFYQIAHELSHSLGTLDLYNSGQGNLLLTLMGRYSFTADDQVPVHLDFLVERRSNRGVNAAYDSGFPGDGVLVWQVNQANKPAPPTHLGAPNLTVGGSGIWQVGSTTPPLTWPDGTSSGVALTIHGGADLTVSWG